MRHEFEVNRPDAGRRVDRFVQSRLGQVPGSLVRRLLRQKKVRINGARAKGDEVLAEGDVVVVHHADRRSADPSDPIGADAALTPASTPAGTMTSPGRRYAGPPIEVLLERDGLLFVAKPAGVACSDDGHDPHALDLWARAHLAARIARGEVRPEPCHRLDRGTTGVVVLALGAVAFDRFRRALDADAVRKEYEVVVWGRPDRESWRCDVPLVRRARARADEPRVVGVDDLRPGDPTDPAGARAASTEFEVIASGPAATRLRARPITGRTHQIRAHCLTSGLPVVGDPRYGDAERDRTHGVDVGHALLHARRLRLEDVTPALEASTPWPAREEPWLERLGVGDLNRRERP